MNKAMISGMLPEALKQAANLLKGERLPKGTNGKIAAFGPGVLLSGLKPTVALYSASGSETNRRPVANAIFAIARKYLPGEDLLDSVKDLNGTGLEDAREYILSACVALKLAARTFKEEEDGDAAGTDLTYKEGS